jgi:chemotaxis protein histidine kinase CheA
MNVLDDDNLMQRCITVAAKHWQDEVYEPIMVDSEWDESGPATKKRLPEREPTALHRALPSKLQNYILEKCIIEAKHDFDKERAAKEAQEGARKADVEEVTRSFDLIVRELQNDLNDSEKKQNKQSLQNHLKELEKKTRELETELETQKKIAEAYKQELKRFRRVPGIHNFGEVSTKDPKIIDKTRCTYSANPEHHFPYHRRGDRPPTQMPSMTAEFENLAKENGYIYDDGHGDLLPVFYYFNI